MSVPLCRSHGLRRRKRQDRPQPLAAGLEAVAHGLGDERRAGRRTRKKLREPGLYLVAPEADELRELSAGGSRRRGHGPVIMAYVTRRLAAEPGPALPRSSPSESDRHDASPVRAVHPRPQRATRATLPPRCGGREDGSDGPHASDGAGGNAVAELRDDLLAVADRAIDIVADECFAPLLDNRDAVAVVAAARLRAAADGSAITPIRASDRWPSNGR